MNKVINSRRKILSLIIGIIVSINAIVLIFSFFRYQENIKNKVLKTNMERIRELSSQIKNILYKDIQHSINILKTIIELENLKESTSDEILKKLSVIENKSYFKSLGIIYNDGKIVDSDEDIWSIKYENLDPSFNEKGYYVSDILINNNTKSSQILVAIPLNSKDGKVKAIFGHFSVSRFENLISFSEDAQQYFQIVDTTGRYISGSNSNYAFAQNPELLLWNEMERYKYSDGITLEKIKNDVENKKTGTFYFEYKNDGRYVIYDPLGIKNWYVFASLTHDRLAFHTVEIQKISNNMLLALIEFMILTTLVIIGVSYFSYKVIKKDNHIIALKNRMFKLLLHKTEDIIFESNLAERKITVYNYYPDDAKKELTLSFDFIHPNNALKFNYTKLEYIQIYKKFYNNIITGQAFDTFVMPIRRKSQWKWVKIYSISADQQNTIGILEDYTEEKLKEEEIKRISEKSKYDFLTGLHNRESFETWLRAFFNNEIKNYCAFFILDLDNFKTANDTFGHDVGDKILQETAQKLKLISENIGISARFGGDEFVLFVKDISEIKYFDEIAKKLNNLLTKTYTENGNSVTITASIGGVIIKEHMDFKKIYKKADNALYYIKKNKKGSYLIDKN